jgi:hypothetical protein
MADYCHYAISFGFFDIDIFIFTLFDTLPPLFASAAFHYADYFFSLSFRLFSLLFMHGLSIASYMMLHYGFDATMPQR